MTDVTKLAAVALAALVLSTALAQAGPVIGGLNDAVQGNQGFPGMPSNDGGGPGGSWLPDNNDNDGNWWDEAVDVANGSDNGNGMIDAPVIGVNGKPKVDYDGPLLTDKPIEINPQWLKKSPGQTAGKPGVKPVRVLDVAIACQVAGTPVEFPDDLLLINHGAALTAGTTIKWKVKTGGQGYVQLPTDLPTGGTLKASGVLDGGVEAGKPCTAKLV